MGSCEECGYDYGSLGRAEILASQPDLAAEHRRLLWSVPADRLRAHTRPGSWSALEYGCHVRDMLRVLRDRVLLAQAEQLPRFASMRRDERAVEEDYDGQDPPSVGAQIAAAARALAGTLAGLDDAGWERAGIYPYPAPEVRTVEWMGRRAAHELAHHLFDNRRLLG
jgi:S-DNA-T family DNA segregation ATPase FtsK/SpoIIIE